MSCLLCEKEVYSRGLCRGDYLKERKKGTLENFPKTRKTRQECTRKDCIELQVAKGLCSTHYYSQRVRDLRTEVFNAYGHYCNCCGIDQYEFLTIDHVHNNGAEERREIGNNMKIVRKIIEDGFPSGYQVLCWNCNAAKQYHNGCPHVLYAQPPT